MEDAKPKLVNKEKFEEILASYHPSEEAIKILNEVTTLFLVGITASGRNTLIEHLVQTGKFYYVLSDTTRPRRMHGERLENDGEFYWHIDEETFLKGLEQGEYLEAAVIHRQQVSGSNSAEYKKASEQGKIAVTDIEGIYGPKKFHSYSKQARFVFMVPPGFDEWMRRLSSRGPMTREELKSRLQTSEREIESALEWPYYHYLVSTNLEHNVEFVTQLMAGGIKSEQDLESKSQVKQLLVDLKSYMKENGFVSI